jgi:hypothetical protein
MSRKILIPEEMFNVLRHRWEKDHQRNFGGSILLESDKEMKNIHKDENMGPEERVARYNENFRKFRNLYNKRRERAKNIAIRDILLNEPMEFLNRGERERISPREIKNEPEYIPLGETPKRKELAEKFKERKIERILGYIRDHHTRLGVSGDGRIERRKGVVYKNSNIEDIVRTILGYTKSNRKPDGYNIACQRFLEDVNLVRMIGSAKLIQEE